MFCAFRIEHILIARVFYVEHKSAAKVLLFFELCKYFFDIHKKICTFDADFCFYDVWRRTWYFKSDQCMVYATLMVPSQRLVQSWMPPQNVLLI